MSKGALAAAVLSFLVTPPAAAFDPDTARSRSAYWRFVDSALFRT